MSFFNFLSRTVRKLFVIDKWNIGYVYQSADSLIKSGRITGKIHWLKEPRADYATDPFVAVINNKVCLFYEELDFWTARGKIMVTDELNFEKKKLVKGLPNGEIHLSYPYIFNHSDVTYCIPETSAAKEVALYRVDSDNIDNLTKIRVLISDEAFVDSSLLFYNDKYWLFTSKSGINTELYIFHAETLAAPFNAHAMNPIQVPEYIGRAAGNLFVVGQKLYRPSQNPQKNYGGSVIVSEVIDLNERNFDFKPVTEINPPTWYPRGLHTINFAGDMMIIDGKRDAFSLLNPLKKLARKLQT